MKTKEQLTKEFEEGGFDDMYNEYISLHAPVGNGNAAILAMESGRYEDEFLDFLFELEAIEE